MPDRRPVAFFDLGGRLDDEESLEEAVDEIMDALAERRIAKHYGPSEHLSGSPQTVHAHGSSNQPGAVSFNQADILDANAEKLSELAVNPRPGIDDNPAIVANATTLFEQALQSEAEISPVLNEVAAQTGGELVGFEHRVKTEPAIRDKLFRDMASEVAAENTTSWEQISSNVHDLNRYTLVWPADESWAANHQATMDALAESGWEIYDHKDKNGWTPGDHYNGMNYQLTNGTSFMEIQFHTPESHALKEVSHELYSQARILPPDDPQRQQFISQIWDLWNGDLTHIPPGAEAIGTPVNFLMKRQVVSPQEATFMFYARTDDEGNPSILFRTDGVICEAWGAQTGQWHPTPLTLPEISGLGGSSDYWPVSDRVAMDFIMGRLGEAPRDIRAKGRPTKLGKHADHDQSTHGNWASGLSLQVSEVPGGFGADDYETSEGDARHLSLSEGGAEVGYAQFEDRGDMLHVRWIEVAPEYRGRGVATRLMDEVRKTNLGADIDTSGLTEEGEGFWNSYWSDRPTPEVRKRIAKADFSPTITVVDSDDPKNLIFGWANVAFTKDGTQVEDHQGHMIDVDDLEHMAYNFVVKYRKSGDMHRSEAFGDLVESMVYTPEKLEVLGLDPGSLPFAWWVGFKLPPEEAEKVRRGERSMLSIEGGARLELVDD